MTHDAEEVFVDILKTYRFLLTFAPFSVDCITEVHRMVIEQVLVTVTVFADGAGPTITVTIVEPIVLHFVLAS